MTNIKINPDFAIGNTGYTFEQIKKNARNDWACLSLNGIGSEPSYINVANNAIIPMNYSYFVGDKLTKSGNGVRIGAGVKTVAISLVLEMRWNSAANKPIQAQIFKNGIALTGCPRCEVRYVKNVAQVFELGTRQVLVPVSEGDILTLVFSAESAMDINSGTGFTVQVVEYTD